MSKLFEFLKQQVNGQREAATLVHRMKTISHLKNVLLKEAKEIVLNADFIVSNLAQRVLLHFGEPYEETTVPLPAFYKLATPDSDQAFNFKLPSGWGAAQKPLWVDDPWTWTSIMEFPLKVLADHCDISLELLRHRCADFMRKEGGRSAFGPEIEQAIESCLRRMDLKFPYWRPLPMVGWRAFGKVLQELVHAEAVDYRALPLIWDEIGGPSLSWFYIEFEPRPGWLTFPELPSKEHGGLERNRWLAKTEDTLYQPEVPNYFVLAEESLFKVTVWRDTAECSRLILPVPLNLEMGVNGLPRLISLNDHRPLYKGEDSKLICLIPSDLFGDLDKPAITICPYVAHSLKWKRSNTNPLKLVDSRGEVVARTLQWVDGTNSLNRYEAELYGRGQILLLSENGKVQIESRYGPISRGVKTTRQVNGETDKIEQRTLRVTL